jgi:hypothetical protein
MLLWVCALLGQSVNIPVSGPLPVVEAGRGLAWGVAGRYGVQNAWIVDVVGYQSSCVWIQNNNPTNGHAITVIGYQTSNPRVTGYYSSTGSWISTNSFVTYSPIAAGSSTSLSIQHSGAVKIAVVIQGTASAAGTPDTADIYISRQAGSIGCGPNGRSGSMIQGSLLSGTVGGDTAPVLVGAIDHDNTMRSVQADGGGVVRVGIKPGVPLATYSTGGAVNTQVVHSYAPSGTGRVTIRGFYGFCTGGVGTTVTVADGGTTIWKSETGGIFSTGEPSHLSGLQLTGSVGATVTITVAACAAQTSTLSSWGDK